VLKYLRYLLYLTETWRPSKLKYKISLLLSLNNLNIYKCDTRIEVVTSDVNSAIALMESILNVDYRNEYAIKLNESLLRPNVSYLNRWYSSNGVSVNNDLFLTWLVCVQRVHKLYILGMNSPLTSRARLNSIKIEPLIKESIVIINSVLARH